MDINELLRTSGPISHDDAGRLIDAGADALDAGDAEAALERFWRAGSSTPGSGLALAIVRSLVLGSRGSLELFDNEPSGLAVAVTFASSVPAGSSRVRSRVS